MNPDNAFSEDPQIASELMAKALPLFDIEEPGPVEYIVEGLILDKQLNSLFGDGGLGKSYVALYLASCVASGTPFFGRQVKQRNVLYIDVENLGHEETLRRAFQIARGDGHQTPIRGVYYYSPDKPLDDKSTHMEIRGVIDEQDIGFIVLDSLTLGAVGTNASDQVEVVKLLWDILKWGVPVLTLDHITKAARTNQSSAQAFGSVMKRNAARSMMRLHKEGDSLILTHDKINCGPLSAPLYYQMMHEEDGNGKSIVTFKTQQAPAPDEKMFIFDAEVSDIKPKPPTQEETVWWNVVLYYLARNEPVDAGTIATETGIDQKVVSTLLGKLVASGDCSRVSTGRYNPTRVEVISQLRIPTPTETISGID
jgi:hypothetical protein